MISQPIIDELWASGFTIARRMDDPTNLSAADVPATRSYQWMHLEHDKALLSTGWAPVPNDRHPGRFAPWGAIGNIEWKGLGLFEKPKFEVEAEQAANHAKAHQNVADWITKNGGEFSGSVTVGAQTELGKLDSVSTMKVGEGEYADPDTKTINTTVSIPKDMQPYIVSILEERDRLAQAHVDGLEEVAPFSRQFKNHMRENPQDPQWPALHSIMLPKAIENVRARLAKPKEA